MGFQDWVVESTERFRTESPRFAIKRSGQELIEGVLRRVPGPSGDVIWEREWDVLVILDACRYDVFESEYSDAEWIESLERVTSVGSASPEWMDNTFKSKYTDEMSNTAYVTGNPFSEEHVPDESMGLIDEVWRYVWDRETGTIPPEPLTNQAVKHYQTGEFDRLILHYMQPHWPYIGESLAGGFKPETILGENQEINAFDLQNRGKISKKDHLSSYTKNLHYLINHIQEVLLNSIDAEKVILSADHGESFGEFGIYEHPTGVPLPTLRTVPWAVTSAKKTGEYDVKEIKEEKEADINRMEQLSDLGYI